MHFHFVCGSALEPWDHTRPEGIAGSETCVRELSRRLAARGHEVTVYAPIFGDTEEMHEGVRWLSIRDHHFDLDEHGHVAEPGVWWLCRAPELADYFATNPDQMLFLRCDDIEYDDRMTVRRADKFRHILTMSQPHKDYFCRRYRFLDPSKVSTLGCGINVEAMRSVEFARHLVGDCERDPYRLIWVSSPDRGLDTAIDIFHRARAQIPQLKLHVYYGWEGCEAASGGNPDDPRMILKRKCTEEMDQTGIVWHGRVAKPELWSGHLSSNIWLYSTTFCEAGVVSAMEAQALGAIPVCPPTWGLGEKVKNGVFISGDPRDPTIRDRYVATVVRLIDEYHELQLFREEMIVWAREEYSWEKVVDHHENLAGCLMPRLVKQTTTSKSEEPFLP